MYLTQLTSNRDYADIHVQLMEDLTTLKLDQSNGRIIEFPLTNVSKVYRIVKNDDKWCVEALFRCGVEQGAVNRYAAGTPLPNTSAQAEVGSRSYPRGFVHRLSSLVWWLLMVPRS